MPQLTDDTTLVYDGYIWQKFRTLRMCQYCQHWDTLKDSEFGPCSKLFVNSITHRLNHDVTIDVEKGIETYEVHVKTHADFGCVHFVEREE